jgi:hypothetical protein
MGCFGSQVAALFGVDTSNVVIESITFSPAGSRRLQSAYEADPSVGRAEQQSGHISAEGLAPASRLGRALQQGSSSDGEGDVRMQINYKVGLLSSLIEYVTPTVLHLKAPVAWLYCIIIAC